jgi:hypothetical protein
MGQSASKATSDALMMGTEMTPEMSGSLYLLTWLIALEDFINLVCSESFRSHIIIPFFGFSLVYELLHLIHK